ncbi:alpha-galactosidase [Microbacterium dauci]|uniref:alpha-galactosidase n=1 Tax=Microbacterium dauci TaxID=3048008 RepID=A0ABT6ZA56_9MICO|nr:alpha-galactosidase [Microbacterium sp. LX3-4]MDJ1112876.1 alpha-galactosidase [Microbacterium sp. LX3-4]
MHTPKKAVATAVALLSVAALAGCSSSTDPAGGDAAACAPADGPVTLEFTSWIPGIDDAFLLAAGTPGFGFRGGEVWSTHVAFSGDTRQWFERSALGAAVLGAGERRQPVALAAGARLETPVVVATYSDAGLDGLSARLHPWIRSWSTHTGVRPLTLNTWEAVYSDHSLDRLIPLVARAAEVGVERFVLDDGWFLGRTDDRRALGDWVVDPRTWPDGLGPLAAAVIDAGMQFGLWVEPEMVSPDSRLARAHPEWMLDTPAGTWRWQHALDLAQPDAAAYVFDHLDALLREYPIAYLKRDHNRDLLVPDSHAQTVALYALIDRLRTAHPGVEIESCASGGARIDLGILSRVDRVWTSDTNDPIERQAIQRYTGVLIPPEYLGSHVGDAKAHTTGRTASLSFRLATAFFGRAGIESDLTRLDEDERQAIAAWVAAYRAHRPLLHSGRVVRGDGADAASIVHGVVAPDAGEAIYALVAVDVPDAAVPAPMRMPGLDATAEYEVTVIDFGAVGVLQDVAPPWLHDGVRMSGRVRADVGVAVPLLLPGEAVLLHVRAAAS